MSVLLAGGAAGERLGVGLGNVPESTWRVSGHNEGIMSPECEHKWLRQREKAVHG